MTPKLRYRYFSHGYLQNYHPRNINLQDHIPLNINAHTKVLQNGSRLNDNCWYGNL